MSVNKIKGLAIVGLLQFGVRSGMIKF